MGGGEKRGWARLGGTQRCGRAADGHDGGGELEIQAPCVHDRREGRRFGSVILPPCARRSPTVTEVLPMLYLRGISTRDVEPALAESSAAERGLSAPTIQRLTRGGARNWRRSSRDLSQDDCVSLCNASDLSGRRQSVQARNSEDVMA
jgi:hypothetical protein